MLTYLKNIHIYNFLIYIYTSFFHTYVKWCSKNFYCEEPPSANLKHKRENQWSPTKSYGEPKTVLKWIAAQHWGLPSKTSHILGEQKRLLNRFTKRTDFHALAPSPNASWRTAGCAPSTATTAMTPIRPSYMQVSLNHHSSMSEFWRFETHLLFTVNMVNPVQMDLFLVSVPNITSIYLMQPIPPEQQNFARFAIWKSESDCDLIGVSVTCRAMVLIGEAK